MKQLKRTLLALSVATLSAHVQASPVTYLMNQTNSTSLADGVNYLKVVIDDSITNAYTFTVTFENGLISLGTPKIDSFAFNTNNFVFNSSVSAITKPDSTAFAIGESWVYSNNQVMDGFGKFDALVSTSPSTGSTSGIKFTVTGTGLDFTSNAANCSASAQGCYSFAAHVKYGAGAGQGSNFFGGDAIPTPVPVPTAAWLLGSGLIGLAGIARRKVTAKAA